MSKNMHAVVEIKPLEPLGWNVACLLNDFLPCYYDIYAVIESCAKPGWPSGVSWRTRYLYNGKDPGVKVLGLTDPMYLYPTDIEGFISTLTEELAEMKTSLDDHVKFAFAFDVIETLARRYGWDNVRMIFWYDY